MSHDDTNSAASAPRAKRERSTRYPGVPLAESLKLCEAIQDRGVDGLTSADIATALGYKNIKTNTFSARLSAARQFGLLALNDEGYGLTPLAREILHPVDPAELPRLYRQALLKPPLYADLAERMGGRKLPEPAILANVLYHQYQIIAAAKQTAADAFFESARFAGALGTDGVFRPAGADSDDAPESLAPAPALAAVEPSPVPAVPRSPARVGSSSRNRPSGERPAPAPRSTDVRLDLRLWEADAGQTIRIRAPESISAASFERFLQAFRLLVRIRPDSPEAATEDPVPDPPGEDSQPSETEL